MEDIKYEKGTVTVKQTIYTSYKFGEKSSLTHRVKDNDETFEISSPLKREELYALKAVIDKLLSAENN